MLDKSNYKKYFLLALIIALILNALVGIYIFLIGEFGEIENKILFTTIGLAVFSLLGLCSALVHSKKRLKGFSILGMAFSFMGFLASIEIIWQVFPFKGEAELILLLTILSFSFAHLALLQFLKIKYQIVKYALYSTYVFIIIVAMMLSFVVIFHYDDEGLFFRILGVFAILDVLGSIITPLLNVIKERN